MPYVQSHLSLRLHPKTARARVALSRAAGQPVSRALVVGALHLLWHWTLEYAPYGDLSRFSPAELADAAEWPHDPTAFVDALVESGFLDRTHTTEGDPDGPNGVPRLTVHDWWDYAGDMLKKREARARAKAAQSAPPFPRTPSPAPAASAATAAPSAPPVHPRPAAAAEPAGFASIRALRAQRPS